MFVHVNSITQGTFCSKVGNTLKDSLHVVGIKSKKGKSGRTTLNNPALTISYDLITYSASSFRFSLLYYYDTKSFANKIGILNAYVSTDHRRI